MMDSPGEGGWYSQYDPEPLDVIEAWGLPFHEAVAIQYIVRWRRKNGVEDLRKAVFYLERLIALSGVRPGDVPPPAV